MERCGGQWREEGGWSAAVDSGERREGGALRWTVERGGRVERCGGQWGEEGGWSAAVDSGERREGGTL